MYFLLHIKLHEELLRGENLYNVYLSKLDLTDNVRLSPAKQDDAQLVKTSSYTVCKIKYNFLQIITLYFLPLP